MEDREEDGERVAEYSSLEKFLDELSRSPGRKGLIQAKSGEHGFSAVDIEKQTPDGEGKRSGEKSFETMSREEVLNENVNVLGEEFVDVLLRMMNSSYCVDHDEKVIKAREEFDAKHSEGQTAPSVDDDAIRSLRDTALRDVKAVAEAGHKALVETELRYFTHQKRGLSRNHAITLVNYKPHFVAMKKFVETEYGVQANDWGKAQQIDKGRCCAYLMNVVAKKGTKKRVKAKKKGDKGTEATVRITSATFGKGMDAISFLHRLECRLLGVSPDPSLLDSVKPYHKSLLHEKDVGTRKGGKEIGQAPADRGGVNQAESLTLDEREAMMAWMWSRAELRMVPGDKKRKRLAFGRGWVRDWAWFLFMAATGLRWCSMETLEWSNVSVYTPETMAGWTQCGRRLKLLAVNTGFAKETLGTVYMMRAYDVEKCAWTALSFCLYVTLMLSGGEKGDKKGDKVAMPNLLDRKLWFFLKLFPGRDCPTQPLKYDRPYKIMEKGYEETGMNKTKHTHILRVMFVKNASNSGASSGEVQAAGLWRTPDDRGKSYNDSYAKNLVQPKVVTATAGFITPHVDQPAALDVPHGWTPVSDELVEKATDNCLNAWEAIVLLYCLNY